MQTNDRVAQRRPLTNIQKLIGQRMLDSKQRKPSFYLSVQADVTELSAVRRKYSKTVSTRVATNDFCIRAIALGIEKYPLMAGDLDGDEIAIAAKVNVGLAVAAPQGLLVPVIKNANKKTLPQIAKDSSSLISRAKSNNMTPDQLNGACITLTSLGMYGIESFIAVASPCQCSILAMGKLTETFVPIKGNHILLRKITNLTLAVDHRIVNGAYAARFLNEVATLLENPRTLISS